MDRHLGIILALAKQCNFFVGGQTAGGSHVLSFHDILLHFVQHAPTAGHVCSAWFCRHEDSQPTRVGVGVQILQTTNAVPDFPLVWQHFHVCNTAERMLEHHLVLVVQEMHEDKVQCCGKRGSRQEHA